MEQGPLGARRRKSQVARLTLDRGRDTSSTVQNWIEGCGSREWVGFVRSSGMIVLFSQGGDKAVESMQRGGIIQEAQKTKKKAKCWHSSGSTNSVGQTEKEAPMKG